MKYGCTRFPYIQTMVFDETTEFNVIILYDLRKKQSWQYKNTIKKWDI